MVFSVAVEKSGLRGPLTIFSPKLPSQKEKELGHKLSPSHRKFFLDAVGKSYTVCSFVF